MMERRIPLSSGDEHDAFSPWRRFMNWKAGTLKAIKNGYRRRVRRAQRRDIEERLAEVEG